MAKDRLSGITTEFKRALSEIIRLEIDDPRVSEMASVTHVDLSKDLKYAKAYISVYDTEKKKKSTIETLTHAEHFIKNEIGRRIRIRRLPQIKFILDGSIEYSNKISEILKKV
ncbi:MAG: 30S ribosome-binding factor RbfA [Clostridia bacterium]|nr:30S ribosome-binding factor RbfA [Clostridia bacterium]MBT7123362.1 30S ribosome-binding factor RbfA [Clostridia bacterium]